MAIREIITLESHPDILMQESKRVPSEMFGSELLKSYITDLFDTMMASSAGGIAAIQVGVPCQIVVYGGKPSRNFPDFNLKPCTLINPAFTIINDGLAISTYEHCLSLPGRRGHTARANKIAVTAQDEEGAPVAFEAEGLLSLLLQHEIDHTHGKLFKDCCDEFGEISEFENKYGKNHHKSFKIIELSSN
ncbi:MAG: peptide deformylase [Gammaproteobacteria bacterium]|nr:peptide deformylase [Gammaproteobacteria bacterium]